MKIQKYIKDRQNKYKVVIDDEEYILYDDVIVKYNLLLKSEIDNSSFEEIKTYNDELKSYYDSIKYISRRLRSEKEIYEYLEKKEIHPKIIAKTIKKLKENKFLNDALYLNAYFKDQINLTNNGPKKIEANLKKLGLDNELIEEKLATISEDVWLEKIEKYIDKKIKTNHNSSSNMLKIKITNDLINLGYLKEDIVHILNRKPINEDDVIKKEYEKAKRTLANKYNGKELENKIKERLFRKGFHISNLKELEDEE